MSLVAGSPLPKSISPKLLLLNTASTLRNSSFWLPSSLVWLTSPELFGEIASSILVPMLKSSVTCPVADEPQPRHRDVVVHEVGLGVLAVIGEIEQPVDLAAERPPSCAGWSR